MCYFNRNFCGISIGIFAVIQSALLRCFNRYFCGDSTGTYVLFNGAYHEISRLALSLTTRGSVQAVLNQLLPFASDTFACPESKTQNFFCNEVFLLCVADCQKNILTNQFLTDGVRQQAENQTLLTRHCFNSRAEYSLLPATLAEHSLSLGMSCACQVLVRCPGSWLAHQLPCRNLLTGPLSSCSPPVLLLFPDEP